MDSFEYFKIKYFRKVIFIFNSFYCFQLKYNYIICPFPFYPSIPSFASQVLGLDLI